MKVHCIFHSLLALSADTDEQGMYPFTNIKCNDKIWPVSQSTGSLSTLSSVHVRIKLRILRAYYTFWISQGKGVA